MSRSTGYLLVHINPPKHKAVEFCMCMCTCLLGSSAGCDTPYVPISTGDLGEDRHRHVAAGPQPARAQGTPGAVRTACVTHDSASPRMCTTVLHVRTRDLARRCSVHGTLRAGVPAWRIRDCHLTCSLSFVLPPARYGSSASSKHLKPFLTHATDPRTRPTPGLRAQVQACARLRDHPRRRHLPEPQPRPLRRH